MWIKTFVEGEIGIAGDNISKHLKTNKLVTHIQTLTNRTWDIWVEGERPQLSSNPISCPFCVLFLLFPFSC